MIRVGFIGLLLALTVVASCQNVSEGGKEGNTTINRSISVNEFEKKIQAASEIQLFDVRTPGEYSGGHLKNAVNININSGDFAARVGEFDKTKPVYVYCLSGGRSSAAADRLAEMGFREVYNMDGGMMSWERAGKAVAGANEAANTAGMSEEAFGKLVSTNTYVLVDYNAKWCVPCKTLAPIVEKYVHDRNKSMSLVKVDADENKLLMSKKNIARIPYLELYHNGKLEWSHTGLIEEAELIKQTGL